MGKAQKIDWVFNEGDAYHEMVMRELFVDATHLDCMVAFAKRSGLNAIRAPLKTALTNGLKARFVVGLDFFTTDPEALQMLMKLSDEASLGSLSLHLGLEGSGSTFHPKVYAFRYPARGVVVAGSANLTSGGLWGNWEASLKTEDDGGLARKFGAYLKRLIEAEEIVEATPEAIMYYKERHRRFHAMQKAAANLIGRVVKRKGDVYLLADVLEMMRGDQSEWGFETQARNRRENTAKAVTAMRLLAATTDARAFSARFDELRKCFHSGGLDRHKGDLLTHADGFREALRAVPDAANQTPSEAFEGMLRLLRPVVGAGTNMLTEMLMAVDCRKFAVMNQNTVSGLRQVGVTGFPLHPSKDCQIASKRDPASASNPDPAGA